jgi:uncharacterized protein (TIGR02117 family)
LKKAKRLLFRSLIAFVAFLLVYAAAIFVMPKIQFQGEEALNESITCYLKSNGSHVDIVMPIVSAHHDWTSILSQETIAYSDSTFQWIAFGWGDKNFFLHTPTWGDLTFSTAFQAAFWLGSGAIHVTYYKDIQPSENCLPFALNEKQTELLFAFIKQDFEYDKNEKPLHIPTEMVYGPRDTFFASRKRYSLFHTCNTWVNDALKSCEHKHCLWTALEFGVMDLIR